MNSPSSTAPGIGVASEFEIPAELELHSNGRRVPASVKRVTPDFIQFSSLVHLPNDTRLHIIFDRQRIEIEVAYCRGASGDSFLVGARMNPEPNGSRRREPRVPLDLPGVVFVPNSTVPINSRVVDKSENGLGLTLPFQLEVGTYISVELSHGIASGEIRHCTEKSPGNWRVGMFVEKFVPRNEPKALAQTVGQTANSGSSRLLEGIKKLFHV